MGKKLKDLNYKKFPDLKYKVCFDSGEYGGYYTEFYRGIKIKRIRKFLLFGPYIEYEVPNKLFSLSDNIEDCSYTSEYWRKQIDSQMERHAEKEARCKEIKNNKIVY